MSSRIFSGCAGTLLHINPPFLTLPATVNSSPIYVHAHTHTHAHRKQQRLLMSRNAHRSVKQHDSCLSGGGGQRVREGRGGSPPTGRLLSAANGAPQSDNGTPVFSRHGCVNTVETGGGRKGEGGGPDKQKGTGGRRRGEMKRFPLQSLIHSRIMGNVCQCREALSARGTALPVWR